MSRSIIIVSSLLVAILDRSVNGIIVSRTRYSRPSSTLRMLSDIHQITHIPASIPAIQSISYADNAVSTSRHDAKLISKWHNSLSQSFLTADEIAIDTPVPETPKPTTSSEVVPENTSPYTKVDKTGFIGFFANGIEIAIDFGHDIINKLGVQNSYGYSIILFTILVKALTLPLTKSQLESTSKMQKLTPLQQKIQKRYADDEATKNQLLSQLFQAAQVNPLAGCLPALVQIPIFISLYRALTNLVAENKLDEPFLWIPDLEGPVYLNAPSQSMNWVQSILTGNPSLGWHDTLCFLSLPFILFVSQTISQKVLQPPKDPNKVLSEQELFSQGILNNLPLVVAFFSINVPAGLAVYWIVNNLLTTAVTLALKSQIKDEGFPVEVMTMMEMVDAPMGGSSKKSSGSSNAEMNRRGLLLEEKIGKKEGFGSKAVVDVEGTVSGDDVDGDSEEDDEISAADETGTEAEGGDAEGGAKKRKKRVKPAAMRKDKKKRD